MKRKSKPGDARLLRDDNADPVDRASAMSRLVADGLREHADVIATFLHHPSETLRGEAVLMLVGVWGEARHLPEAERLLAEDESWLVRANAAAALGMLARLAGRERSRVARRLADIVAEDAHDAVRRRAYEELAKLLDPGRALPGGAGFDPSRDVDWALVDAARRA